MQEYDQVVYDAMMAENPPVWCRAFYQLESLCEDVENNSTESFNNTIMKAREIHMMHILKIIARQAMISITKRSTTTISHNGRCTPYAEDILAKAHELSSDYRVYRNTNNMFQVVVKGCSHLVNLDTRSCSCRKYDVSGIPCEHAYGVIISRKLTVEDYVSHWFHTSTWRSTYAISITPMRGAMFWPTSGCDDVYKPPSSPQPGRKKKSKKNNRKKGKNKSPIKKKVKKRIMHCGICGDANHNCRFHSDKPHKKQRKTHSLEVNQVETSQGVITQ